MFSGTITVDDASGDDVSYALVNQDSTGSRRLDVASTLAAPGLLSIKHSVSGKGKAAVDRHLVQLSRTITSSPQDAVLIANFTLAVPRDTVVTSQIVHDTVANLLDFLMNGELATLTTTNIDSLLRGES